ncbi:helix-turn-helix domain-containing protein [Streptomyces sp. NPDC093510]|uniref:helix-turn-helix domain-containing protein n=1 Tax=Streptomyces sp. NPDC093510 TaxID=3155199 RepID=UPI003444B730
MDQAAGAGELASLLTELKRRSGLSFQELAGRTFLSRTTVHRFCSGARVPNDYAVVVRLARECGAEPEDLNRLLAYWRAATRTEEPDAGSPPCTAARSVHPPELPPRTPGRGGLDRASARWVLGLVLAVGLSLTAVASGQLDTSVDRSVTGGQVSRSIPAPSWEEVPFPVPRTMFGVTMNSSSGAMPTFQVGGVRLWDSETRWANLEPERGTYDWVTLDRLLAGAHRAGLPTLFVVGGTPSWAAPNGRKAAYPDGSRAAPPDDLDDGDRFVRALVQRSRGRIDAYELWVMANDPHYYNGGVRTLVEMTRRAARIIREHDEAAVVVCPSMGRLWEAEGRRILREFARLGGYQHCDVAGVKLHQRNAQDPPETMLQALELADQAFHEAGVHPELWNTGTTYSLLLLQKKPSRSQAADYAVRFYLTGLYARRYDVQRMYLYAWGNDRVPIVLQPQGGPPTRPALNVERLQRWIGDARIRSCGRGDQIGMPDNVWQCEFLVADAGGERAARIRWTHTGRATTPVGPDAVAVERLDGTVSRYPAGGSLQVTESPVLISGPGGPR